MNSEGPCAPLVLAESEAQWDGVTEYRFSRDAFGAGSCGNGRRASLAGCMALPRNRSSTSTLLCPAFLRRASDVAFQQNGAGLYFLPDAHLSLRDSKLTWYRKGAVARSRPLRQVQKPRRCCGTFWLRAPEDAAL
ncbi:MAG: hypothetical protein ACLRZH_05245 [Ruthenibacterium lactatiformans]